MIGKRVAQFEIQHKLGEGGMGVVYKALDTKLNRVVALKFLPASLSEDATAKARFIQEAQAASSLDHANICTIYEIGETPEGELFIAMAYYDGNTLKYILDGSTQSMERVQSIGRQLARALRRAHREGITHRDIKPANIMITKDQEVKLLDFGLAKLAGGRDLTVMGSTVGTAAYMSPEQMRGDEVTAASDIWSLGAVLYEMATGRKPFTVEYDQALMYAILNEQPEPVSALNPKLPEPLARLIDACLDKNPENRPSVDAIKDAMGDESSGSRSIVTPPPSAIPPAAARPATQATSATSSIPVKPIALGVLAIVLIAVVWILIPGDDSAKTATPSTSSVSMISDKSVAVLPFTYRGGDSDEAAAFAGGIHDDLLSQLSRIAGLTVISRTSVMQYENTTKPISEIAAELGVKTVLEGSVQKAGDRIRIITTLVDASTGAQLWSQTYDEQLSVENIFAIQSDLSGKIAEALQTTLTAEDQARMAQSTEISEEAYDLFTRGVYKMRNSNSTGDMREGAEMLKRVTDMAPSYARAFAQLSWAYRRGINRGVWSSSERGEDSRRAAERALELDPLLPEALLAMSNVADSELRFEDAENYLLKAMEVAPSEATAYADYANLLYKLGRPSEALESAKKAVALDPLDLLMRKRLADVYFFVGMYEDTITESRKVLEMQRDDAWSYYNIGYGMALLGRVTEALAAFQKAVEIDGSDTTLIMGLAWGYAMAGDNLKAVSIMIDVPDTDQILKEKAIIYGVMGDLDTAFELLDRAYAMNPGAVAIIAGDDSIPKEMQEDPRFKAILRKMGLEPN